MPGTTIPYTSQRLRGTLARNRVEVVIQGTKYSSITEAVKTLNVNWNKTKRMSKLSKKSKSRRRSL